jgi:hypothetical protein
MSDKLISELVEKTGVENSDQIALEGSGGTWKITLLKLREYLFGIFPLFGGTTTENDFLLVKQFGTDTVYRVSLGSVLPDAVVQTKHLENSTSTSTGITESKIAPAAVTHSKLAIDSVHTHNIANAEASNSANWTSKQFGTGVTTDKIVDGAVTGAKGGVPVGAVFHFAGSAAPAGYLDCDGGVIPAFDANNPGATFKNVPVWRLQDLRTFLGANFGAVGKLPDLRGVFIRGLGQNAVQTVRTFVLSGSFTNLDPQAFESVAARVGTVSYTIEFYSDSPLHLNKLSEQTIPVTQTTTIGNPTNNPYRVYANKGVASAALGAFQGEAMQQHYHAITDPGHTHPASGNLNGDHRHLIGFETRSDLRGGGGATAVSGFSGNGKGWTKDIDWMFGGTVVGVTVTPTATGITSARYPAEVAAATVDETRPVNTGLLACIKY